MSQLARLSEAEIEERFQITSARAIAFTLAGLARDAEPFSVHFGDELFLTTLLAVFPERRLLIFDCSGAETLNQRLLQAERCSFTGRPAGIHVQFSVGRVCETLFTGARAFAVSLPTTLIRLQRRETFRIETSRGRPLSFFGRLPGASALELGVHDVSVSGVGLSSLLAPDALEVGQVLEHCHFQLPEEAHELFFSATIRHITERQGRASHRQWRIGLQFAGLPAGDENRIQRYIVRLERERHELN